MKYADCSSNQCVLVIWWRRERKWKKEEEAEEAQRHASFIAAVELFGGKQAAGMENVEKKTVGEG